MTVVGAIDCGTNSTRLLVTDGGRTLDRRMRITRLGEGVGATGVLKPAAIERTLAVLEEYHQALEAFGAERVRITATSAARDARNRDDFFDPAERIVGTRPELLSGEEEGRVAFSGATAPLDPVEYPEPVLVADIGGGSTELVVGRVGHAATAACSLDVGCVRITEAFLRHDPPRPEELSDALAEVRSRLEDAVTEVPVLGRAQSMIGLAGTVTTVAAVEQGLASYDRDRIHHFFLTRAAAEDVFRTLATEARADRIFNPGLERERADVIVGGCVVLVAVLRFFDFPGCLVSEDDILDGLAASLQ